MYYVRSLRDAIEAKLNQCVKLNKNYREAYLKVCSAAQTVHCVIKYAITSVVELSFFIYLFFLFSWGGGGSGPSFRFVFS